MSYYELLACWAQSDVTATAYRLTWTNSRRPEHAFLLRELQHSADVWLDLMEREQRHMQQRMPRV